MWIFLSSSATILELRNLSTLGNARQAPSQSLGGWVCSWSRSCGATGSVLRRGGERGDPLHGRAADAARESVRDRAGGTARHVSPTTDRPKAGWRECGGRAPGAQGVRALTQIRSVRAMRPWRTRRGRVGKAGRWEWQGGRGGRCAGCVSGRGGCQLAPRVVDRARTARRCSFRRVERPW